MTRCTYLFYWYMMIITWIDSPSTAKQYFCKEEKLTPCFLHIKRWYYYACVNMCVGLCKKKKRLSTKVTDWRQDCDEEQVPTFFYFFFYIFPSINGLTLHTQKMLIMILFCLMMHFSCFFGSHSKKSLSRWLFFSRGWCWWCSRSDCGFYTCWYLYTFFFILQQPHQTIIIIIIITKRRRSWWWRWGRGRSGWYDEKNCIPLTGYINEWVKLR